jgi:hypothetical protein
MGLAKCTFQLIPSIGGRHEQLRKTVGNGNCGKLRRPGSRADSGCRTTLVLFEHDTVQHQADLGGPGPGPGDQFIFAGDVFDRPGGMFLGTTGGSCPR